MQALVSGPLGCSPVVARVVFSQCYYFSQHLDPNFRGTKDPALGQKWSNFGQNKSNFPFSPNFLKHFHNFTSRAAARSNRGVAWCCSSEVF